MKKILLIVSFVVVFMANAQTSNKMDTIYKQNHNQLLVCFIRNNDNAKVEWKTVLTNKNGKELIIHNDEAEKNIAWKFQEERGESPIDLYNISGTFLDDKDLYIIYNRFGEIFLSKYSFTKNDDFIKDEKFISKYLTSGGFGKMINKSDFKKIDDNVYFNLLVGQRSSGSTQNLYKMNLTTFSIKKLTFEKPQKLIKSVSISKSGKEWYDQEKLNIGRYSRMSSQEKEKNNLSAPSKSDIEKFNLLTIYIEKPFYYYQMPIDKAKNDEAETFLFNNELDWYPLFSLKKKSNDMNFGESNPDGFLPLDDDKIIKAEEYLNELFNYSEKTKSKKNVKLIDFIYQSVKDHIIFFFYKESMSNTNIIRYDNYKNEWLLGDYKEEEIKQE